MGAVELVADCVPHAEGAEEAVPKRPAVGVLGVIGVPNDGNVLFTAGDGEENENAEVPAGAVVLELGPPKDEGAGVLTFPNENALLEGAGEAAFSEAPVDAGVDPLSKEKTVFCPQDTIYQVGVGYSIYDATMAGGREITTSPTEEATMIIMHDIFDFGRTLAPADDASDHECRKVVQY
jgi:hypothetical protein